VYIETFIFPLPQLFYRADWELNSAIKLSPQTFKAVFLDDYSPQGGKNPKEIYFKTGLKSG
jgi:hypothetical protein